MAGELTDTREMTAVHDAFRMEFAALPGMIASVPDGDVDRAAVVGGHVMMMTAMLHGHHESEDVNLWPLLEERAVDRLDLVRVMESQHARIGELLASVQQQAGAWMSSSAAAARDDLAATVSDLDTAMREHLALEEDEILPVVAVSITPEEFARLGEHSRASLTPEQLAIGLGTILDDTSPELGAAILEAMPPEARAGFEQFGRPAYAAYRARLTAAAA